MKNKLLKTNLINLHRNFLRIFCFVIILNTLYLILYTSRVSALTPTPSTAKTKTTPTTTPKPTTTVGKDEKLIEQINNLKEKVASKVAELQLVEKRGIIGIVKEVQGTNKILLTDLEETQRIIDIDELTKFSAPGTQTDFGISDIKSGTTLGVIGLYNKQSKRLLARFVNVLTLPAFITGQILEVDKANYTVLILSENKNKTLVDIENVTKTSEYTDENGIVKYGFSKLQAGDRVSVVGYPNKTDKKRITGSRVLIFPDLPKNPKIIVSDAASSDSPENPATSSAKKITPTN